MHGIPVALTRIVSGSRREMTEGVQRLLQASDFSVPRLSRVLIKPNLVTPRDPLAVTDPEFVRAVCIWFLDHGARVSVGDSPAFGSALNVAVRCGLLDALKGLDLELVELDNPRVVRLASGIRIGVSKRALETEFLINCPKLKAHSQVGITAAVKNLFGCVTGFRKAFAHFQYGDVSNRFESLIIELADILPQGISLVDGVMAMDTAGPSGGKRCGLCFAGASPSPFALDTVIYSMLGVSPDSIPIYRETVKRGLPGSSMEDIRMVLDPPDKFDFSGFTMPGELKPVTFHPLRLLRGRLISLLMRLTQSCRLG